MSTQEIVVFYELSRSFNGGGYNNRINLDARMLAPITQALGANMAQFTVYSNDTVVGYSELENGDAPMGVTFGAFKPSDEYSIIRHECLTNHLNQSALKLSVRTDAGLVIPCAGVSILDYSAEADSELIGVNVLGIPYPIYSELFPEHVASYDQQFH